MTTSPITSPRGASWRAPCLVALAAATGGCVIGYSYYSVVRMINVHDPLRHATQEARSHVQSSHLWLEEYLSGDPDQSIDVVWAHFDRAEWHATALLEGGEEQHVTYVPVPDQRLRDLAEDLANSLSALRALARERVEHRETSGVGTARDEEYDRAYDSVIGQTERVGMRVDELKAWELVRYWYTQAALITGWVSISLYVLFTLRRNALRQRRHVAELEGSAAALRESEERYRGLFDTVHEGFALHDMIFDDDGRAVDYRFVEVNPAFEKLTGLIRSDVVGRTVRDVIPDVEETWIQRYGQVVMTGEPVEFEQSAAPLGQHYHVSAFRPREGQFACMFIDTTEHVRARAEVTRARDRAQMYVDVANVMLLVLDRSGSIELINPKGCDVLGYDADELLGKNWFDLCLPEDTREAVREDFFRILAGEADLLAYYENPIVRQNGEIRQMAWHNTVTRDDEGNVTGTLSSGEDVTDRLRAEEERRALDLQLQELRRLESLGVLAGGVAHEFNSLLTGVIGNTALAQAEVAEDSVVRELLEGAESAATRAAELSKQMLAFSGGGKFVVGPSNLSALVVGSVSQIEELLPTGAGLKTDLDATIPDVAADEVQIRQLLMGLAANAAEAIDGDGTVTIGTRVVNADEDYLSHTYIDDVLPAGQYVALSVTDDGAGMDEETQQRAFEPFFSTKFTGRGLGLAAVLGIARGHSGAIDVASAPGEGTTVTVLLPVMESPATETGAGQASEDAPRSDGGERLILVADDEESVLSVSRRGLEAAGYGVVTAEDGPEAVELFREHAGSIALCLIDISMPTMDGREVSREIRALRPDVPVLMTSGYTQDELDQGPVTEGSAGFIQKPFVPRQLVERVREIIGE